ncbi:MAG TPA: globin [Euzebyales bacterium]|nr:globin [Euzebyales bacterium]
MSGEPTTVFERVGGEAAFHALVEDFYAAVEQDPVLRPHYPDDLEPGTRHLGQFLAQYFGGGPIYSRRHGHPRLRMRHAPFVITEVEALRWAQLMAGAIGRQGWPDDAAREVLAYVARAAPHMINTIRDP